MLISVLRFVGFKRAIGPMASRQLTLDYESLPGYTQIEVADAEIKKKNVKIFLIIWMLKQKYEISSKMQELSRT